MPIFAQRFKPPVQPVGPPMEILRDGGSKESAPHLNTQTGSIQNRADGLTTFTQRPLSAEDRMFAMSQTAQKDVERMELATRLGNTDWHRQQARMQGTSPITRSGQSPSGSPVPQRQPVSSFQGMGGGKGFAPFAANTNRSRYFRRS